MSLLTAFQNIIRTPSAASPASASMTLDTPQAIQSSNQENTQSVAVTPESPISTGAQQSTIANQSLQTTPTSPTLTTPIISFPVNSGESMRSRVLAPPRPVPITPELSRSTPAQSNLAQSPAENLENSFYTHPPDSSLQNNTSDSTVNRF